MSVLLGPVVHSPSTITTGLTGKRQEDPMIQEGDFRICFLTIFYQEILL
jgi:hypothetical protein